MKFTETNETLVCTLGNLVFGNYFKIQGNNKPIYYLLELKTSGKVSCLNLETRNVDILCTNTDVEVVDITEIIYKTRTL